MNNDSRLPYALLIALALIAAPALVLAQGQGVAAKPQLSSSECAVWLREQSFARSVAEHDASAFADHVALEAAFNSDSIAPLRGRAAIVEAWSGLISGERLKLSWYPTRVTIAGVPDIAASSGPALYESLAADAEPRFRLGAFHSVWHKNADGQWRVLFDDGITPRAASDEEVQAFRQQQPGACALD